MFGEPIDEHVIENAARGVRHQGILNLPDIQIPDAVRNDRIQKPRGIGAGEL
jgi:hypothetical protein